MFLCLPILGTLLFIQIPIWVITGNFGIIKFAADFMLKLYTFVLEGEFRINH